MCMFLNTATMTSSSRWHSARWSNPRTIPARTSVEVMDVDQSNWHPLN